MVTVNERYYPTDIIESIVSRHLRISVEDGILYEQARRCVCNAFDAAEDYTNRIIVSSMVEFTTDEVEDGIISLPTAPIQQAKVLYLDDSGAWQEMGARDYELMVNSHVAKIRLFTDYGASRYKVIGLCGFNDYSGEREATYALPGAIEQAVCLLAGTFFEFQADNLSGTITSELPMSAKALLNPWRIYPYGG